ncbi:MAG: nucleotidyltransferase domain-containing protein [Desulfurococcaceae archaeon]
MALQRVFMDKLVSVVVFGFVARGEARVDSDVDFLIVAQGLPKSRFKMVELFERAEELVEPLVEELWSRGIYLDFSPIILDVDEAVRHRPIYLDMVAEAVIVFDRDGFFKRVLDNLAERLKTLGAERKKIGRLWYWVLKKEYRPGEVIEI